MRRRSLCPSKVWPGIWQLPAWEFFTGNYTVSVESVWCWPVINISPPASIFSIPDFHTSSLKWSILSWVILNRFWLTKNDSCVAGSQLRSSYWDSLTTKLCPHQGWYYQPDSNCPVMFCGLNQKEISDPEDEHLPAVSDTWSGTLIPRRIWGRPSE